MDNTVDTTEAPSMPSMPTNSEHPLAVATETTAPQANTNTSEPIQDPVAIAPPFTTPFPNQANGLIPQVQDFAINPAINGNGVLPPMDGMIPMNPSLPELNASHPPPPVNGHAISAGMIVSKFSSTQSC